MTSPRPLRAGYQQVAPDAAVTAVRDWWNTQPQAYLEEHGEFLGERDFCWCPEGLREADAQLLGPVQGQDILEIGAGAGQCARWLHDRGARVVASDIADRMLGALRHRGKNPPSIAADAQNLPFADQSFDAVFTAYGALPFLPDPAVVHREVARVLRPAGRWVFSLTHPIRWAFPDDPGPRGLQVTRSYFDQTPYVERDETGRVTYAEYHHTLGAHVSALTGAGFILEQLIEPPWPAELEQSWDSWSPLRGEKLPGTVIFVTRHSRVNP